MRKPLRRIASVLFVALCAMTAPALARGNSPQTSVAACGGGSYPKPGGGVYQCTFSDEFNGKSLDSTRWWVQTTAASGFHPGPECFVNTSNNIKVAGGYLSLTVRRERAPFTCSSPAGNYVTNYTSGMVMTWGKFAQAYGRFEVRAKFPAATAVGLQESLWMMPQTPKYGAWPRSGEIDIAEHFSIYPAHAAPYVHYVANSYDPNVTNGGCRITEGDFHRYVLQWTPSSIQISFDGTTCINDAWNPAAPLVKPQPFDRPFVVALTQALGVGANAPTAATPLPATTQVDYVRVWS